MQLLLRRKPIFLYHVIKSMGAVDVGFSWFDRELLVNNIIQLLKFPFRRRVIAVVLLICSLKRPFPFLFCYIHKLSTAVVFCVVVYVGLS